MREAMAAIPDGARVAVASLCAVPTALVAGLCDERNRWSRLDLVADYLIEPLEAFEHPGEPFHAISLQPSRAVAAMRDAGVLRSVPAGYSQFTALLAPGGPLAVDVALVQVSPPGPEGRFSLGVLAGSSVEVARTAPLVIAEVNPQMPYTFGASELHRDEIDLLVDVDHPVIEMHVPAPDETATAIGGHAAGEIPDGSTLQLGIGAIPEAILAALAGHRDLHLHGGMLSDAVVDLVEAGVIDGPLTTGSIIGSRRSFDWVDRNEQVRMAPASVFHGIAALSAIDGFVAINSALEIAADGSVNAEMAAGTSVTVPRYLADRIITEFGVARLAGVPIEDRPAVLDAITHPDFRSGASG